MVRVPNAPLPSTGIALLEAGEDPKIPLIQALQQLPPLPPSIDTIEALAQWLMANGVEPTKAAPQANRPAPAGTVPASALIDPGRGRPGQYVAAQGDTAADIAQRAGVSVKELFEANRARMKRPEDIRAGKTYRIPAGKIVAARAEGERAPDAPPTQAEKDAPCPEVRGAAPNGRSASAAAQDLKRVSRYRDQIIASATKHGIDPSILAGVISRETRGRNIIGDHGHGHGLTQIDDRSFPAWTANWKRNGRSAAAAIEKGAEVLEGKMRYLKRQFPRMNKDDLLRAGLAAYNGGEGRVARALRNRQSVDSVTTGHNYSTDVLARAAYFEDHGF